MIYVSNPIVILIGIIVSLISIFFGINVMLRCSGKLRLTVIFLILAISTFAIKEIFRIFTLNNNPLFWETAIDIIYVVMVGFILLALITMNQMIKSINHNYHKKKK